jgi:rubrerythrin
VSAAIPPIRDLAELYTIAYRIESDAVERYDQLAAQMDTFNNPELARIFRDLSTAEGIHAEEIRRMAGDIDVTARAREVALWKNGESPESADLGAAHYMMTPWHALQMALKGEEQALAFFDHVVQTTSDDAVRKMAAEFVEEENEHVDLVRRLLRRYQKPPTLWADDPDPAIAQE